MAYARTLRVCGAVAAFGALLLGCSEGGRGGAVSGRSTAPAAGGSRSASAGAVTADASPGTGIDRAEQPKTAAQARSLINRVIAGPDLFGAGVRRATPYERDPSRWAVLGNDCIWRLRSLPAGVLATSTRRFELPASGAKGSVRLTATVTVRRSTLDASWQQAMMLQEALACDEQTQRQGERLIGLASLSFARGEGSNTSADDMLLETGQCVGDVNGGPYPYWWQQAVLGPVVVGASVCGGRGRSERELNGLEEQVLPVMLMRAERQLGSSGPAGSGTPGASPSASATGSKEGS